MAGIGSYPASLIVLIGTTGSGKSSFANLASGSEDLEVGSSLISCTSECQFSQRFTLDGRKVILVDTPGFNDMTEMSDTKVWKMIAAFLERTYETGVRLTGIIYFHRISDGRFTRIDDRNFGVFRRLCGDRTLRNVAILTNMWGKVSLEIGLARERELPAVVFGYAINRGARYVHHVNTLGSAHSIILALLENNPVALQIQEELVDRNIEFTQTTAGQEIRRGLDQDADVLEEVIGGLRSKLEDTEMREQETRQELEEEINSVREMLEDVRAESMQLEARYREQRDEMQSRTDSMMRDLLNSNFVV